MARGENKRLENIQKKGGGLFFSNLFIKKDPTDNNFTKYITEILTKKGIILNSNWKIKSIEKYHEAEEEYQRNNQDRSYLISGKLKLKLDCSDDCCSNFATGFILYIISEMRELIKNNSKELENSEITPEELENSDRTPELTDSERTDSERTDSERTDSERTDSERTDSELEESKKN